MKIILEPLKSVKEIAMLRTYQELQDYYYLSLTEWLLLNTPESISTNSFG